MKKVLILTLLVLLPMLTLVSAVSINMPEKFQPGETLLATISANILSPLTSDEIYFYSDRQQMPVISDVALINNSYYLYAQLPNVIRNYTLLLKNLHYFENSQEYTADVEKNFSVEGNFTDFSVTPGFIIARSDFSITVESKSQRLTVHTEFTNTSQDVIVNAGQKKQISLSIAGIKNFTFTNLTLTALNTRYSIPVAVIANSSQLSNNSTNRNKNFRFEEDSFSFAVNKQTAKEFTIFLENTGEENLTNIDLGLSENLKDLITLDKTEIENLRRNGKTGITLTINSPNTGSFSGNISATSNNESVSAGIIINSLPSDVTISYLPENTLKSCQEILGARCSSSQTCKGNATTTLDGLCCTGICQSNKSYTGLIVGIIILLALGAGIFFLYQKSKKKPASADDIIQKRQSQFEERVSSEVKGNLSKS